MGGSLVVGIEKGLVAHAGNVVGAVCHCWPIAFVQSIIEIVAARECCDATARLATGRRKWHM